MEQNENQPRHLFDLTLGENVAIAHIDDNEVFRLTFNPQIFTENFYKSVPIPEPPAGVGERIRSIIEQQNIERSDEEIAAAIQEANNHIMKVVHEAKASHIATRITENLHSLLVAVIEDAVKAYAIEGTIELNKQAGRKIPIGQFKDVILKQHWSRIRDLAGIKQGGARERKGFVWTDDKKIAFYEKMESQAKINNKSIWQYALDTLIEQNFDADTISWLKSRPVLQDVPRELFDKAVKTWRKYLESENWRGIKTEDAPRAFEYRYALHVLGYPKEFTCSTLETYYYEGKKLSDNQT